ncbi:MAG: adenine-specific methyltransferase EcoRI family protein [Lachnospiraceae bacterium]|nr:adenine-specific methyltransferase EcoRI family protein [Lachnospiraceae bacterium]
MAAGNSSFGAAKANKDDEFYTQLTDIEKELRYYRQHFRGKTVLCNCDDPFESNFFKYFVLNFNRLGLKKLISTCYATSHISGTQLRYYVDADGQLSFPLDDEEPGDGVKRPYKAVVTKVYDKTGDGSVDMLDVAELFRSGENELTQLEGDGDFQSPECLALLDEADIVVTNPPFSLFREYIATLIEHEKQFLIIGSQNNVTYKDVFPLMMNNKVWLGYKAGDMAFTVPDYYEPRETRYWQDENGQKWRSLGNICWFTNLDIRKRHEQLILVKRYSPDAYPSYENLDNGININRVVDIPCDYAGLMGVPITFMSQYNPEQFEIIGLSREMDLPGKTGMSAKFIQDYYSQGGTAQISEGHPDLGYYDANGKCVVPYRRVIIRNKHPEESKGV